MIINKCRLCLKNNKNVECIFGIDNSKGRSYAEMINSIANVKVFEGDGMTDQICLCCRRKTREFWDFKLQVESSYTALQENCPLKRVCFTNINDVELTKKVIEEDSKSSIPLDFTKKFINNNDEPFNYNDTVIKKVPIDEKNPLTVIDFLNAIKEENENDFQDDIEYEVKIDYDPDVSNDPDYKMNQPLKKNTKNNKENKEKYQIKTNDEDMTILRKPLKPVFLADYKLMPTIRPRKKQRKTKADRMRVCPYCGIMTESLRTHLTTHSNEKPFKCEVCSKAYGGLHTLKSHMKQVHGDRVHNCELCAATFRSPDRLKSHLRMRHTTEKKHICNVCSKAFKLNAHLRRHIDTVHSLGPKKFQCELCPDRFNSRSGLRHHLRVHTRERPYNCEMCSQPYSYKHDFNRHCMKKHGVCFSRRSVFVMNQQVLVQERILMRDLMLRFNGILKDDKPVNPFEGPQGVLAFEQMIKAIQSGKIVVDLQL